MSPAALCSARRTPHHYSMTSAKRESGAVLDVADGTLKCRDQACINDHSNISIELPDSDVPSIVQQEQLDYIGLEISISGPDEVITNVCTKLTPGPGQIQTRHTPLRTGYFWPLQHLSQDWLCPSEKVVHRRWWCRLTFLQCLMELAVAGG